VAGGASAGVGFAAGGCSAGVVLVGVGVLVATVVSGFFEKNLV
jgi:hypothetical protein